jgi:hypothetical protein
MKWFLLSSPLFGLSILSRQQLDLEMCQNHLSIEQSPRNNIILSSFSSFTSCSYSLPPLTVVCGGGGGQHFNILMKTCLLLY